MVTVTDNARLNIVLQFVFRLKNLKWKKVIAE